MAMHSIPVAQAASRPGYVSSTLTTLAMRLNAWRQQQRQRADMALLMSMEPHMLKDVGIELTEQRGASAVLRWHPAVLATTMQPPRG